MRNRPGADGITHVRLAVRRELDQAALAALFDQPADALAVLTADLEALWQHHRTDDPNARRTGGLDLESGAYLQWLGHSGGIVVECSSNAFLAPAARLDEQQERTLVRAGFQPPGEDSPNFWLEVGEPALLGRAAFAVVAVLTAVFGVYAG